MDGLVAVFFVVEEVMLMLFDKHDKFLPQSKGIDQLGNTGCLQCACILA